MRLVICLSAAFANRCGFNGCGYFAIAHILVTAFCTFEDTSGNQTGIRSDFPLKTL